MSTSTNAQGQSVKVVKETTTKETGKIKIKYVKNYDLAKGESKVKTKGNLAYTQTVNEVTYVNGVKTTTKKVSSKKVKAKTRVVYKGVGAKTSTLMKLAKCESGAKWKTNTGNGYYGAFQFSQSTWKWVAKATGIKAKSANKASKADQIKAARYLQSKYGWSQWPSCSRKLGLL